MKRGKILAQRSFLDRIYRIDRIKKRRCDMKSDIGKFRLLSRMAFAVMVLVAGLFICHCGAKVS